MQVPAELEELFVHFDKDCNGILDQEEILSLVQFWLTSTVWSIKD